MSNLNSIKSLHNTIIKDNDFNFCVDEITYFLKNPDGVPEALLIVGEPGCGKTFVGEYVVDRFNPAEEVEISKKSVIMIRQIENISLKSFYEALLDALGDPSPTQGKLTDKKMRIIKLKERLGLLVVILDEFHDMLPRTVHERSTSIKFTKWLMVDLKVSVIMMGLPDCLSIIEYSSQIETRLRRVIELRHFSLSDEAETKRFAGFMRALFKSVERSIDNFFDANGELLRRFVLASRGNKRIIKRLLKTAMERSEISTKITLTSLHEAWLLEASKKDPFFKSTMPFKSNIERVNKSLQEAGLM